MAPRIHGSGARVTAGGCSGVGEGDLVMVQRGAGSRRGGIGGWEDARLCMCGAKAAVRVAARGGVSFGTCGQQLA